jgi:CubicO group peptidase (beta-lactamase class C family)
MKKQISGLIFLSCFVALIANNFFFQIRANNLSKNTEPDTTLLKPTVYAPEEVGMSSVKLARIDSIVNRAIREKVFAGCQVFVMKNGKPVYEKSFGTYTYESSQKVQPTSMYDLASLTKTTATLLAIMKLYDTNKLKLGDKVSAYLTFLRGTDKENITIQDLLFHETGLPGGMSFYKLVIEKNNTPAFLLATKDTTHLVRLPSTTLKYKQEWVSKIPTIEFQTQVSDSFYLHNTFHKAAMQKIADTKLNNKTYLYSCVNFILLKEIVEAITGTTLDVFLNTEFYIPMGLKNIAFLPLRTHKKEELYRP